MHNVFSHIVHRRLSRENEDVATDALAYIIDYSKEAKAGIMRLIRAVVQGMPDLRFQTQQTEGSNRPDLCGYDCDEPRVFIENKFWAGLTAQQPVAYLESLARHTTDTKDTLLLVVAPEAREQSLWNELKRRLNDNKTSLQELGKSVPDMVHCVRTGYGPVLALTSWTRLMSALQREIADDKDAKDDLSQLEALCNAANTDLPISSADVTDQRTPALILQLSSVVYSAVEMAQTLVTGRLRPQADRERIGRYAAFGDDDGVGVWLGIHFRLWRLYGGTPLWAVFSRKWGRAREVRVLLESWAAEKGIRTYSQDDGDFVLALDIAFDEEREHVARRISVRLDEIGAILTRLPPKPDEVAKKQ